MSFLYESVYLDKPFIAGRSLDIFIPGAITRDISMVFIHGGGWRMGSRQQMHKIMEAFCDLGFICASFDYRLSGVDAFEQLTDLRHAYDFFVSFLKKHKRSLKIVTYGSSAGAHLNALMSLTDPGGCGEKLEYNGVTLKNQHVRPAGCILQAVPMLFEPWEDIFPGSWKCFQDISGVSYEDHPEIYKKLAPMEYLSAETPPLLFLNASDEHMFPTRYTLQAAEKLQLLGRECVTITYENAEHGFFYDITRRVQKQAFEDIIDFISNLQ